VNSLLLKTLFTKTPEPIDLAGHPSILTGVFIYRIPAPENKEQS
jgi:hypothetical protein